MARPDIRLTPDEQDAFLREHKKCALATLDRHGFPHIVAMNFVFHDGAFYMTSYGKAQKVLNIHRDPKVAVMVETGGDYAELRGVMARGECEIIEDPERVRDVFARLGEARGATTRPSVPKRVVLRLRPRHIVSWDHKKLGGRY